MVAVRTAPTPKGDPKGERNSLLPARGLGTIPEEHPGKERRDRCRAASALTFDEISIFINTLASPEQDLNFFHLTYRKRTKIESLNILLNLCKSPEAGNGQRAFTPGPNPG